MLGELEAGKRAGLRAPGISALGVILLICGACALLSHAVHSLLITNILTFAWAATLLLVITIGGVAVLIHGFRSPLCRRVLSAVAGSSVGLALCIPIIAYGCFSKREALEQAVLESEPLAKAIEAYKAKYGHTPISIQMLVPEFIDADPTIRVSGVLFEMRYDREEPWSLALGGYLEFGFDAPYGSIEYRSDGKYELSSVGDVGSHRTEIGVYRDWRWAIRD